MGDRLPLSQLTLGDADSFLESLICQTQGSGVSDLNTARGEDVSDEDRALQFADQLHSTHEKYKTGNKVFGEIMSKFDVGSTVAKLSSTVVAKIEPEDVMTATCVALSAASNVVTLKLPDVTVQRVLESLKRIEGKLDKQLKAPLNLAIDGYKTVMSAVRTANFKLANDQLHDLIRDARTAFHYANDEDIKIESYRECCKAVRLLIFATILQASFDEDKKVFLPPDKLPQEKLDFILQRLEDIIGGMSKQKDNVKLKSFGLFTSDSKKSEVQDLLDSILKITYPYISQARKLTDMNKQLEYSGGGLKFSLLPQALPMGYEDKTPVIVGCEDGKNKSVVKVNVWRSLKFVWYEQKDAIYYKSIISECEPVDMEDAVCPGPLTLSAAGLLRMWWSGFLGDHSLTEKEHRGRPVYRSRYNWYLYSLEDGCWGVSTTVGDSVPCIRSTSPAPSPVLCQHWEYREHNVNSKYKDGDFKVTFE